MNLQELRRFDGQPWKCGGSARSENQLRKYRRRDYKAFPPERRFESILRRQVAPFGSSS